MINHLFLICSTIIIYEFLKYTRLKNIVLSNLRIYKKIFRLMSYNKGSDHRKEKLIFNYSKSLLLISIKTIIILISILVFMMTLNLLSNSFLNLVISILGILELSVIFLIYHLIRKNFHAKL